MATNKQRAIAASRRILQLRRVLPETRPLEFLTAYYALDWTFLLLKTPHLFRTNPAYQGLQWHGSEMFWGIAIGASSLLEWAGWIYPKPILRSVSLFISAALWLFISLCIALVAPRDGWIIASPAVGVYGMTALVRIWAWVILTPFAVADAFNLSITMKSRWLLLQARLHRHG